jgi:uncharacterized ion transporter superfamily protein YfcC
MKSCCKDVLDENNNEEDFEGDKAKSGIQKLKEKWKLNSMWQLLLVICTFALGGTACGMIGKQIMHRIGPDHKGLWLLIYILLITILWPACVLIISIPLGQFNFFKHYLQRMGKRIVGKSDKVGEDF